ncbi:MAG: helix-turn-helix domain-containing protein [Planctomycetes bacterium]|nr:helix-turn-helix domain-containing protein [Planctomycetota bacterium]
MPPQSPNLSEAAEFLGVSASTLRNWDQEGKLRARRHPVNGYRLDRKAELEDLLRQLSEDKDGEA